MTDWRDLLKRLSTDHRIKAGLAFELASDRASGAPVAVATDTLRAVARAEGLDTDQPWIVAAARDISLGRRDRPALGGRHVGSSDVVQRTTGSTAAHPLPGGDTADVTGRSRT